MSRKPISMEGKTYGRLTVLSAVGRGKDGQVTWSCACSCGNTSIVGGGELRRGNTSSCGCLARELTSKRSTKHGDTRRGQYSPEHRAWTSMLQRCRNETSSSYRDYGARGISVCDRWSVYENFIADMGRKPASMFCIDRIDNDGNYEPGNCRWATRVQSENNKRSNRRVSVYGLTMTVAEWARATGLSYATISQRVSDGWSPSRVVGDWSPWGEAF